MTTPVRRYLSRISLAKVLFPGNGSGFWTGFLIGLLITVLETAIILFAFVHRSDVGDSLIRLGQHLKPRSEVQTQNVLHPPQVGMPTVLPTKEAASSIPPKALELKTATRPERNPRRSATVEPQPVTRADEAPRLEARRPIKFISDRPATGPVTKQRFTVDGTAPPALFLGTPASPFPKLIVNEERAVPQPVQTSVAVAPAVNDTDSTLQMYFDIGKFKDELLAHTVSERVARLGLPTTVIKRKFLWRTSYQVLVGPYSDEEEETRIQVELFSRGYKPRAFERGSRNFLFLSRLSLDGSRLPVGDSFTISWESYVADANVRLVQSGDVIATARGKWIKRPQKYSRNEYVYVTDSGSKKTLLEIHFSGLNRALVFGSSS